MSTLIDRAKRVESPIVRVAFLRGRGTAHMLAAGHVVRARRVREYLARDPEPALQVGGGPLDLPGWLNGDLIAGDVYLDLERRLPLPDARFAYAFGEHVIEHIAPRRVPRLLAELRRVLRPGGTLRLTTPDLAKLVAIYEDRSPDTSRAEYSAFVAQIVDRPGLLPAAMLNTAIRGWGHRHIYDEPELTALLLAAGFSGVERVEPGTSAHERLVGIERHGKWVNRVEAMTLESTV